MRKPAAQVVVHADDIGMCHGANAAFLELSRLGICTAGSVMVPCPWFLETAEMAAKHPELDIGVHLTLNAEKRHYRWRPLTAPGQSAGLTDGDGYFWRTVDELRRHARPEAVEAELTGQVEAALAAGIDVTHLDAHMGAARVPEFVGIYLKLAETYRVPALVTRNFAAYDPRHNLGEIDAAAFERAGAFSRERGWPVFDQVLETPWERGDDAQAAYGKLFDRVEGGLVFLALHFNAPGEIESIEPATAHIRTQEYELFRSEAFGRSLADRGWQLTGLRPYRDALRCAH
jgi:predicted glycoside hydrolase/deacetylase ChbG (UPF0249 family)